MVSKKSLKPPKARKKNKKIKVHGLVIKDDYSWLRDDNWQEVLKKPNVLKPNIPRPFSTLRKNNYSAHCHCWHFQIAKNPVNNGSFANNGNLANNGSGQQWQCGLNFGSIIKF